MENKHNKQATEAAAYTAMIASIHCPAEVEAAAAVAAEAELKARRKRQKPKPMPVPVDAAS